MSAVRVAFREPYQVFRWFNGGDLQADFATMRRDYQQVRLVTLERLAARGRLGGSHALTIRRDKIGRPLSAPRRRRLAGSAACGAAGMSARPAPLAGRRLIGRRRLCRDVDSYEAGGIGRLSAGPAVSAR